MSSLLRREWQVALRAKGAIINPVAFLLLSTTLFVIAAPDTVSSDAAAGILWTLVLLTQLLALDAMYRRDFDSGVLEQTLVSAQVPFVAVLTRIFMQWLSTGFIMVGGRSSPWHSAGVAGRGYTGHRIGDVARHTGPKLAGQYWRQCHSGL
jgi:heme exporter protein CcmB